MTPMSSLQHAMGWSHEATKNFLTDNKMTDIVKDVFICAYRCFRKHKRLIK